MEEYFEKILQAHVYEVAKKTPLEKANNLSSILENDVYLKREDLQEVFSFKIRGAYNKISSLKETEFKNGIVCSSAGNHAQGVSYSTSHLLLYDAESFRKQRAESFGGETYVK